MSRNQKIVITLGLMLSLFMSSMEATVIATAMPTIVSQLGGLEHYSWVFSAYMVASTTTVPLYGKLSDLFGRRSVYLFAMILFLIGSVLCGMATSMVGLIVFRAIQGIGAGGVQPLIFIMIGEMFTTEQRARFQGIFSAVWGVSSVVGPLLGGFLVDQFTWPWVFFVNVIPGIIATALVVWCWRDQPRSSAKPVIDYMGAALLMGGAVALLLGLMDPTSPNGWLLIGLAIVLLGALVYVERQASDPILPLPLFRARLFSGAVLHGVLSGWAVFGSLSFVPLFVQSVLGASPTQAGATLTPMLLGWVFASILSSRLLLRVNYRTLAVTGMVLLVIGASLLAFAGLNATRLLLMFYLTLMGIGMGLSIPAFMIAVQSSVERRVLGTATSMMQFARTIGGALGVSVMGAVLSLNLAAKLSVIGKDVSAVDALLAPEPGVKTVVDEALRGIVAGSLVNVFMIALVGAVLGLISVLVLTPRGQRIMNAGSQVSKEAAVTARAGD